MRKAGIDVDTAVDAGDLAFQAAEEAYRPDGQFNPERMVKFVGDLVREKTEDSGYDLARLTGEMTWALKEREDLKSLVEYEQALNSIFGECEILAICQYNTTRFAPEIINQLIRSHPKLIYGGAAGPHFYYLPPEVLSDGRHTTNDRPTQSLLERIRAYETLEQREQGLSALANATQELMIYDETEIINNSVSIIQSVLDLSFASFWTYNQDTGELELRSSSPTHSDLTELIAVYEDDAWETFVTEQPTIQNDLPSPEDFDESETWLRSGLIVPVGRHGVFCTGSIQPHAITDPVVDLALMIGSSIEAALDRADRERTLTEQNDQLERLNRINRVIRGINEAIVDANTREAIEQIVCERLTEFNPYQFTWIGDWNVETETVTPRAQAGNQSEYLDNITISSSETATKQELVTAALKSQEVQVVQDVLTDSRFKLSRKETLSYGFRAAISIPLLYNGSVYGVLTLYTETPNTFDELEISILTELGETIAHAIDAAETKQTLQTDHVTELTLEIPDSDGVLATLAREIGCQIELDGLVPLSNNVDRLFLTTYGVPPNEVLHNAQQLPQIIGIEILEEEETTCSVEITIAESTLAAELIEQQAFIQSLTITAESTTTVIDLSPTTEVREFIERLRSSSPKIELIARHARDRPIKTRQELREEVSEQLTARQLEVLEIAYLSGFFESPRIRTGAELSETLDIAQSTFISHLREAERRLCKMVFQST